MAYNGSYDIDPLYAIFDHRIEEIKMKDQQQNVGVLAAISAYLL